MISCSEKEFLSLAQEGHVVPVYQTFSSSFETPLSVYLKIGEGPYRFLLESVEEGRRVGRYSFIGSNPYLVLTAKDGLITLLEEGKRTTFTTEDPLKEVEKIFERYKSVKVPGLPGFTGGAIGYLGYEMMGYFEKMPASKAQGENSYPDCVLMFTDQVMIYDHVRQVIQAVVNVRVGKDKRHAYQEALVKLKEMGACLNRPIPAVYRQQNEDGSCVPVLESATTQEEYQHSVEMAKKHILEGDIFQVVLSQQVRFKLEADPLEVYRNLRSLNPSPYMFYLHLDDIRLIGSSPEFLVKMTDGEAEIRPIAGTRPRGKDEASDKLLEQELRGDEKEKAEHLMLVDLGRNDIGRVCSYGTVQVEHFMEVERYSHVMHLVSRVKGSVAPQYNQFDVFRACFPAGTVSGAPKIRAMEIIDSLEPAARGPYAGAVGYFGTNGDMDTCITIRTIMVKGQQATLQAGAGIVADSDPLREYQEVQNKAAVLLKAVELSGRRCSK